MQEISDKIRKREREEKQQQQENETHLSIKKKSIFNIQNKSFLNASNLNIWYTAEAQICNAHHVCLSKELHT